MGDGSNVHRILRMIYLNGDTPIIVKDLSRDTGIEYKNVYQYLKFYIVNNIIIKEKIDGRHFKYRMNPEKKFYLERKLKKFYGRVENEIPME